MENVIVFCCACNNHYPVDQVKEIKVDWDDAKRYLCNECLENMPVAGEVKRLEVVK
jgi:predicted SprT family Zn-dependent metalloprotease